MKNSQPFFVTDVHESNCRISPAGRRFGHKPKMHRADAEKILAAELAAINGGPVTRAAGAHVINNRVRVFFRGKPIE